MVCSPFLRKFYGVIVISNFTNRLVDIFKKRREMIMYIICGVATTLVSLLIYYVCAEFFFDVNNAFQLQIINVISWVLSVLFAFVTNKILVFKSKASPFKEMMRFYLARIGTLLIDMFLMYLFVTVLLQNDMLAKCVVSIVVIILNYIFGKVLVFRKENSNEKL